MGNIFESSQKIDQISLNFEGNIIFTGKCSLKIPCSDPKISVKMSHRLECPTTKPHPLGYRKCHPVDFPEMSQLIKIGFISFY